MTADEALELVAHRHTGDGGTYDWDYLRRFIEVTGIVPPWMSKPEFIENMKRQKAERR